ncbi:MAG: nicotinamide riboside transporter PnuC [Pirellula sp.]|jgi:nicotinamide mononucleotide transporter
MSTLEIIAALFGLACVWLTIVRNVWSWPTGLVQVLLLIVVFWQAKLYADMLLQVVFVVFQVYGWWQWTLSLGDTKGPVSSRIEVAVRTLPSPSWWLGILSSIALLTGLFSSSLIYWTDAQYPIADSFIAATSLVAQTLLAKRFIESWPLWIVVDSVAMFVFWGRGLYPTAILYGVFWIMAVMGWMEWVRSQRQQYEARTDTR